jgi:hypothetical protein
MRLTDVEAMVFLRMVVLVGMVGAGAVGQRGGRADQARGAQVGPEGGRDRLVQGGGVLGDPAGSGGAGDDGGGRRVGQGELEGGGLDADAVLVGKGLETVDALDDLRRGLLVLEVGAAGEDAGAVGATDDHVDVLFLGHRQQPLQGVGMVEEGVAAGEEEPVGPGLVEGEGHLDGLGLVDAQSPGPDDAFVAQAGQDAEGSGAGLFELLDPGVAVEVLRDVVDPDDVEAVDAHTAEAALDGALGGVGGPLVEDLVGVAVLEQAALLAEVGDVGLRFVEDDPADLGGQHVGVAGLGREHLAQALLGEAGAVEGCGVVVADALVPGGLDSGAGVLVGDRAEHVAQRGGAEAETAGEDFLQGHERCLFDRSLGVRLRERGYLLVRRLIRRSRARGERTPVRGVQAIPRLIAGALYKRRQ